MKVNYGPARVNKSSKEKWEDPTCHMSRESRSSKRSDLVMVIKERQKWLSTIWCQTKIETPKLLPGGWRGIVFLVLEQVHIWGK